MSQLGKESIAIYTLSNISKGNGNQTFEIYSVNRVYMRNIFLEKQYTKCGEKLFPDPFLKNQNIFGSIVYSFMQFVLIVS